MIRILTAATLAIYAGPSFAQQKPVPVPEPAPLQAEAHMTLERLAQILLALDSEAQLGLNGVRLTIEDVPVVIIFDVANDRMRAMVPIRAASEMTADELMRVLQANFDTALDARYAVADGRLWAAFIHPFAALERDQLISGIAQTVNIAKTYGTLYSGGAGQFGQGDSENLQRQLLEKLLDKGQDI